jgi:hypothetical protein
MKVGDLIRPLYRIYGEINGFRYGGKMEIIQMILPNRILVKYHDSSTLNKEPLFSWESSEDFVVDVQRTREERLKELGI